jgi:guanylate kinase
MSGGRGRLIVLSGPSGVGKSAVAERLLLDARFARAVTATTRPPRGAEKDGVDYHFLSREEFSRRVAAGGFLEHAEVYGRLYGTPREGPRAIVESGRHCLLVIDVQGARTLRDAGVEALYVFLEAPSERDLVARLRGRGVDAEDVVRDRLAAVAREMAEAPRFDLRIVNREIEDTARKLAAAVGVDVSSSGSGTPPARNPSTPG